MRGWQVRPAHQRRMGSSRWVFGRALLVCLTLSTIIALVADQPPLAAQDPPDVNPSSFIDQTRGSYLTIQLTSGTPDYGLFSVAIPGVGVFSGGSPAQLTVVRVCQRITYPSVHIGMALCQGKGREWWIGCSLTDP